MNEDGQKLYRHVWPAPSEKPAGIVFFLHGGMEHCRRYDSTAAKLNSINFTMVAHDYVGHGRSEGERNYVHSFQVYVRDVCAEVSELRRQFPGTPVFLAGISMGGLIGCFVATEMAVDGLVLVAPAVKPDPRTATPTKVRMARMLNKVLPRVGVAGLNLSWISRNQEEVETYSKDELVYHHKMRSCFAIAILDACDELETKMDKITAPLLVLHGEDDKITSLDASRFLIKHSGSTDKKLVTFPECRHNLLHELPEAADKVHTMMLDWLQEHATSAQHHDQQQQGTGADRSADATAENVAGDGDGDDGEGPRSPPPSMATSQAADAKAPTATEIESKLESVAEKQEDDEQEATQGECGSEGPRSPPPSMATSQAADAKAPTATEIESKLESVAEKQEEGDDDDVEEEPLAAVSEEDGAKSPPPSMATSQAVDTARAVDDGAAKTDADADAAVHAGKTSTSVLKADDPKSPPPSLATSQAKKPSSSSSSSASPSKNIKVVSV